MEMQKSPFSSLFHSNIISLHTSLTFLLTNIYYFWLCWVFIAKHSLSLITVSGGLLLAAVHGPSLVALEGTGSSRCGMLAQLLCCMWNLPRLGIEPMSPALKWILICCTTREVPSLIFLKHFKTFYITYPIVKFKNCSVPL